MNPFSNELPKEPFWMVYGIGQGSPTVMHDTLEMASNEAKRLARAHKGVAFAVLRAVGGVICDDLKTVNFHEQRSVSQYDDEIPF